MKFFLLIFLLVPGIVVGQNPWKNVYTESAWDERDTWQKPDEIIKHLNIKSGSYVADVGSHEGYMTIKLSHVVRSTGKVFAVDVDQSKLDKLRNHLIERNIENTILVKGDYNNPKLPANMLDAVMILDTYHEMDDHDIILQHIKAALKSDGRLVICEPIANERKASSREDQEKRHELGINYALEDLVKAGFEILYKNENFVDRTTIKGDVMWVIVARRK